MKKYSTIFILLLFLCIACIGIGCQNQQTAEYIILYKDANASDFSGNLAPDSARTHTKGTTTILQEPNREWYQFEGWYLDYNALFNPVTQLTDENFNKTNTVTVYAKWSATQSYTIDFDKQGGTGGDDQITNIHYTQELPYIVQIPTKQDNIFVGYFDQLDGNGKQYFDEKGSRVVDKWDKESNATLYAKWMDKDLTFTITLDKQGGTGGDDQISNIYQQLPYTIQIPTKQDNFFVGYFDQLDGNGKQYFDEQGNRTVDKWDKESDATLYAKWIDKDLAFTITLDKQGGIGGDDNTQSYFKQDMPQVQVPTLQDHSFVGYFDQPNGIGKQYYDSQGNSTHIWDKWQNQEYKLYAYFLDINVDSNLEYISINNGTSWSVKAKDLQKIAQTIHIPSTYQGLPVVEIADDGFYVKGQSANRITTQIIIEEGITKIGKQAFIYYSSLTDLQLPTTLKHIDNAAFQSAIALRTVHLPKGLQIIGEGAFGSGRLESVTIPNTVIEIGGGAFDQTGNNSAVQTIKSLTFEDGGMQPLDIYEYAFDGLLITTLTLPARTKQLGGRMNGTIFGQTINLQIVYIPKSIDQGEIQAYSDPFAVWQGDNSQGQFIPNPKITIYLPDIQTLTHYQQATGWQIYANQMQVLSSMS